MAEQPYLDPPEEFDAMSQLAQLQLRAWIQKRLEPTKRIGDGQYSYSYGLKHLAERELGWYVSNGQMKGAMLAEGYRWEQCEGTLRNSNPNWVFNSKQRRQKRA